MKLGKAVRKQLNYGKTEITTMGVWTVKFSASMLQQTVLKSLPLCHLHVCRTRCVQGRSSVLEHFCEQFTLITELLSQKQEEIRLRVTVVS